jgi:hypothetical protein
MYRGSLCICYKIVTIYFHFVTKPKYGGYGIRIGLKDKANKQEKTMLTVPEQLHSVSHPMVASMYVKKDYGSVGNEDVLVIETNYSKSEEDYDSFDSYLMELLGDLRDLKRQAEEKVGHIDRIDIRTH